MKHVLSLAFCFAVLAAPSFAGNPKPVEVVSLPTVNVEGCLAEGVQLLGFSSETTSATGIFAMTNLCQADFPGSRICTESEILTTRTVPPGLAGHAWVVPTRNPAEPANVAAGTCEGWTNLDAASGLTVDQEGSLEFRACNMALSVACCGSQP
jgi:hypothetical protein